MSRNNVIISIIIASVALVAIITASLAWFLVEGAHYVTTDGLTLSAAEASAIMLDFDNTPTNDNRYFGEKGIEYTGYDRPYVVEYDNIGMEISRTTSDVDLSMAITQLAIKLAGLDSGGNERIVTYTPYEMPAGATENLLDYFTIRIVLREATLLDGSYDDVTGQTYRPQQGFLVNTVSTTEIHGGREYPVYQTLNIRQYSHIIFALQIVFQSESTYQTLLATQSSVEDSYATPLSDPEYMYSHLTFNLRVEAKYPYTITFDAGNGEWGPGEQTRTTTVHGWEYVTLPSNPSYTNYRFDGWMYEDLQTPFTATDVADNGIDDNLTVYATYTHYPEVFFHKIDETVNYSTYIPFGDTVSVPSYSPSGYRVIAWSEDKTATWTETAKFFNFSTPINRNYHLYPVVRQTHTVTIDLKIMTGKSVTIEHYVDGTKVQTVNGASQETYTITVYDGDTFGSYFNSTSSSSYIVQTDCSGLYKFYGWVESPDTINTSRALISHNVTQFNDSYVFNQDVTVYAQVYLSN